MNFKWKWKWLWYAVIVFIISVGGFTGVVIVELIRDDSKDTQQKITIEYEKAYFEGQRAAMEGDLKIKKLDNKTYMWIKTPHADSTKPYKDTILINASY